MGKISAIILAKNAEDQISDCIESVSFCDEILVIDDNSSDRTVDLSRKMGARVEEYRQSENNFAERRNFGLKRARYSWVFYIDSDERMTKELQKSIKSVLNQKSVEFNSYKIQRKNFYFGNHEWPQGEVFTRLFYKPEFKGWTGKLHESPVISGDAGELEGYLLHYTHRDLFTMVQKTLEWSKIEAELRYGAGHPQMTWWRFPRVMFTAFYDSYVRQRGYKAGTAGVVESIYQAFSIFITYARLWEMQIKNQSVRQAQDKKSIHSASSE